MENIKKRESFITIKELITYAVVSGTVILLSACLGYLKAKWGF